MQGRYHLILLRKKSLKIILLNSQIHDAVYYQLLIPTHNNSLIKPCNINKTKKKSTLVEFFLVSLPPSFIIYRQFSALNRFSPN